MELLRKDLEAQKHSVIIHSFPDYESEDGKRIRRHLTGTDPMSKKVSFAVYLTDMLVKEDLIEKELEEGNDVILDRYIFSTIAYGSAAGTDYENAKAIERAFALPQPDIVVYIDMPIEKSMLLKAAQRKLENDEVDKYERNRVLQEKVREVFTRLMDENFMARKWVRVAGHKSIEEVHTSIMNAIMPAFEADKTKVKSHDTV